MSQEQESKKVYELAKELGLDSLTLVGKLKELNIDVKSHMSALSETEVNTAMASLAPKSVAAAKAGVVKKTTATRTRKKATDAANAESADAKASSTIIRRRTRDDGATETITSTTQSPTTEHPEKEVKLTKKVVKRVKADSPQKETITETTEKVTVFDPTSGQSVTETISETVSSPSTQEAASVEADDSGSARGAPKAPITRKSILNVVKNIPTPKSQMRIIEQPSESSKSKLKPGVAAKQQTSTDDELKVFRMNKESLDRLAEEEASKKRGVRDINLNPEDVKFADYRKKEVVFLPKKKKIPVGKEIKKTEITTPKASKRVVEMHENISVQDLASQLQIKAIDVVRKLMGMGQMVTINSSVDFDTATLVANEYQYEVKSIAFKEEALFDQSQDQTEQLKPRPPVVTIMGHVDHGKTTLLDSIRESNVAAKEAGGITQHIGAYTIEQNGKLITFIDTPGHEAFSSMRARGANLTDIVILVVAADDGVMPQTREAISHAKAAKVPIIVAVNKMDKPGANPEKIKQALAELELLAEDWGGDTMFVPVSAVKKTGIKDLLEAILLNAEMLDLKANPDARAEGIILEARLEKGRGPVATILVKRGTLKLGDYLVAGTCSGKIRAMSNYNGKAVKDAQPGIAVEILGLDNTPQAGDKMNVTASETDARKIIDFRVQEEKARQAATKKVTLEDFFSQAQGTGAKELKVVLKADVFGSLEAVKESLTKIVNDQVKVSIIHSAIGAITESDVLLASASQAVIIGFNVRPDGKAQSLASSHQTDIKCYSIIYELIDEVKKAMTGLLDKQKVEKTLGRAEVRQTFVVPKIGTIAGSSVLDGKMLRNAQVRLVRDGRVIYEGKMSSLKRFKDDAREVAAGYECGIGIENYNDIKPGDVIEAFEIELITPDVNL